MKLQQLSGLMVICVLLVMSYTLMGPLASAGEVYTLEESIDTALEKSRVIKESELELEAKKLELQQAEGRSVMETSPPDLLRAQRNYENALKKNIMTEFSHQREVEKSYYQVVMARDMIEVLEQAVEVAEREYEIEEERLLVEKTTQQELLSTHRELTERREELAEAIDSHQLALLNYRKTMGLPLDTQLKPEDYLPEYRDFSRDIDQDIENAIQVSPELEELRTALASAEEQVRIFDNDYTAPIKLRSAKNAMKQAQNGLQRAEDGMELQIRRAYLEVEEVERRRETLRESRDEAEEAYKNASQMKEMEMATEDDVRNASLALKMAETEHRHVFFEHRLAVLNYQEAAVLPLVEENN